jgi:hypothetical protein
MANVGAGTVWNLPNYTGELITASPEVTPLLTAIGGLTSGGMQTDNFEFPLNSYYAHETAAQPAITETTSLTAPTAISFVRAQQKNVTQIFQEQVSISYERLSNQGRLSGINTANSGNPVADEKAWQIQTALKHIARDIEFTILQGSYQIATSAAVANKTRGINEAASDESNTVAAGSADLSKTLLDELFRTMETNGADFENMVLVGALIQKQRISDVYGYAPMDRTIGGVNIKQIETDIGNVGVVNSRFQASGYVTLIDMAKVAPVFQPVPNKGNFFYEELSKTGAAESGQIFGKFGLAYTSGIYHGTITGLSTS